MHMYIYKNTIYIYIYRERDNSSETNMLDAIMDHLGCIWLGVLGYIEKSCLDAPFGGLWMSLRWLIRDTSLAFLGHHGFHGPLRGAVWDPMELTPQNPHNHSEQIREHQTLKRAVKPG